MKLTLLAKLKKIAASKEDFIKILSFFENQPKFEIEKIENSLFAEKFYRIYLKGSSHYRMWFDLDQDGTFDFWIRDWDGLENNFLISEVLSLIEADTLKINQGNLSKLPEICENYLAVVDLLVTLENGERV